MNELSVDELKMSQTLTVQTGSQDDWKRALLQTESNIRDAVQSLDRSALQVVLVVGQDGVLTGTVTDGDIRRGLLGGLTLESPISKIIHTNPLVASPQLDRGAVLQIMNVNTIRHVPVVDDRRRVIGLHVLERM